LQELTKKMTTEAKTVERRRARILGLAQHWRVTQMSGGCVNGPNGETGQPVSSHSMLLVAETS